MIKTPVCQPRFNLLSPCIPQSNRHGIGAKAATNLLVHVPPYDDMECADLIELFWGDCYVASTLLAESDLGQACVLHVPESFLRSGKVKTYYKVTKIGCEPVQSPSCKLWVKLEMPGGHLVSADGEENQGLAPVAFAEAIMHNGLSAEQLERGVDITIASYPNMQAYDEITLRWGDLRMDLPVLTDDHVGKAVSVHVPADLIREAGEDLHQEVTYCVIDRVGNNSRWAPPRSVRVCISETQNPQA